MIIDFGVSKVIVIWIIIFDDDFEGDEIIIFDLVEIDDYIVDIENKIDIIVINDLVWFIDEDRLIEGGFELENIIGGIGNDIILGFEGVDILEGNSGNDSMVGNEGNDVFFG